MNSGICRIVRDSDSKAAKSYSLDATKLTVTEPKALKKGKFCNVRYNGGTLYMETPLLHLPMGVSSFEDDGSAYEYHKWARSVRVHGEYAIRTLVSTLVNRPGTRW